MESLKPIAGFAMMPAGIIDAINNFEAQTGRPTPPPAASHGEMELELQQLVFENRIKKATPAYNGVRRYLYQRYAKRQGSTMAHHMIMLQFCQRSLKLDKVGSKFAQAEYIQFNWEAFKEFVQEVKRAQNER